jgi:hypothetical protein
MKKLIGISLGLLFVLSFANAATIKVTKKTGTQEYFGVAKNILPTGIGTTLGATYIANDTLTFSLPTGYVFKTAAAKYFLVLRSSGDNKYYADFNTNGTVDWGYLSGEGLNELKFRLVDAGAGKFTAGNQWFLCTAQGPFAAWAGSNEPISIQVPAGPTASTAGTDYKISSSGQIGGTGSVFDTGTGVAFFTAFYEYKGEVVSSVTSTIDVAQERKKFLPTGTSTSGAKNINITRPGAGSNYETGPSLTNTDYFKHTITGTPVGYPMQGVKYVQCFSTSNNTPVGDIMTVNVPGKFLNDNAHWNVAGTNIIAVKGTEALWNRTDTVAIDLVPSSTFYGRSILAATPAWTWETNGTLFRTSWFATARNAGYVSSLRIANETTLEAKVYADVYLDDGQKTTASVMVGTVPAKGMWAMDAYDLCVAAGLTPSADALGPSSKGKIFLTVWSVPADTFGHLIYTTPLGTTQMPLEKWTTTTDSLGATSSWWEK